MKGNNKLILNEATMMEAVQYWLNAQFVVGGAPAVTAIEGSYSGSARSFEVAVQSKDPEVRP